jgi:hypothetical protein
METLIARYHLHPIVDHFTIALLGIGVLADVAGYVIVALFGDRGPRIKRLGDRLSGAALVLLRLVGSNESLSRGLWLGAHLVNTLFLLAALTITAWQATALRRRGTGPAQFPLARRAFAFSIAGFLSAGILGTFAALGDTLVVPASLTAGFQADFSAGSSIFVRLRILHPIVAGALGAGLLVLVFQGIASRQPDGVAKRLGRAIAVLVLFQFGLGIANIALLTPAWLQLLHLLGADLLWIACVLLASELMFGPKICATDFLANLKGSMFGRKTPLFRPAGERVPIPRPLKMPAIDPTALQPPTNQNAPDW